MVDAHVAIVGLVVGTLVGLTGIGGGSLLLPLLVLALGVKPSLAVGTDLVISVPMKLLAAGLHAERRNVDWAVARSLALGGVPGALAGLALFALVRAHVAPHALESGLRHVIGFAILLACAGAAALWISRTRRASRPVAAPSRLDTPPGARTVGIGVVVGFLVAITSIGSGSITLPLLIFALPSIALRRLVGAEIAFAAVLVPIAALGQAAFGNVDYALAGSVLVGALPGVFLGTRLATTIADGWLRPVVLGALAVAGSRLI